MSAHATRTARDVVRASRALPPLRARQALEDAARELEARGALTAELLAQLQDEEHAVMRRADDPRRN